MRIRSAPSKAMTQDRPSLGFKPLIGTEEATIDDKGRILFSKKKRERLGQNFAVTLGATGCVVAYPLPVWERLLSEIFAHDSTNSARDQYTRLVLGVADDDLNFDSQGRVVIPHKLRALAKLEDKVLLVGCGDRVEIWSKPEWEEYWKYPEAYARERREAIENAWLKMKGGGGG